MAEVQRGYTTMDVAKRLRVGQDRVRGWIRAGRLAALNTADVRCGRPRFIITPEALAAFEKGIAAVTPEAPKPPRRPKRPAGAIDWFPD